HRPGGDHRHRAQDGQGPGGARRHPLRRRRRRGDGDHHGGRVRRARRPGDACHGPGRARHALQPRPGRGLHAESREDPRQGQGAGGRLGRPHMASVKMPQLGESITEGTISKWLKQPGDQVKKYEGLVEVITDKVNAEVPAPLAGVLKEIKVKEGTTVTVGTEIAVIEESMAASQATTPSAPASQPSKPVVAAKGAEVPARAAAAAESTEGRARLSPAVRALIEEHRISDAELSGISCSGIGGRISKKDIEDYVAKRAQPAAANGEQRQRGVEAPPRPAGVAA